MGDKSLYVYVNKIGKEQFYIFNNGVFEWLGYHRFLQNHDFAEGITVNKVYQEQLDIYLKDCRSLHDRIYRTPYLRKPLLHVFQAYYQCRRKKPVYISSPEKIEFQLMVTAGINRSRIYFDGNYYDYIVKGKYPMSTSPSLGIGLDVIVPKNRKRLSIYNQLEYFTLLAKDEQQTANQTQIGIHSLSLCHSLRYRPYQSKHLSVFVQAGICNAYNKLFRNQTLGAYPQGIEKKALAEIRPLETGYVFGLGGKFYRMGCLLFMQHGNGISTYTALTSYTRRYGLSFSFQLL
jgi:hypothetical protein